MCLQRAISDSRPSFRSVSWMRPPTFRSAVMIGSPCNPLGLARDETVIEQSNSTRTALLSANIDGSALCTIDVAGSFGRDLSAQGEKAMIAFAMEWLTKLFGSELASAVKKSSATRWNASPFALGAMSVAAPGFQPSRKILAEPIGNLFLAGEATHETLWGT